MKTGKTIIIATILLCTSFIVAEEYTPEQKQELGNKAVHEMMQKIFSESMVAKRAYLAIQSRDIGISDFATTAPRSEFIVNADISAFTINSDRGAVVAKFDKGISLWLPPSKKARFAAMASKNIFCIIA